MLRLGLGLLLLLILVAPLAKRLVLRAPPALDASWDAIDAAAAGIQDAEAKRRNGRGRVDAAASSGDSRRAAAGMGRRANGAPSRWRSAGPRVGG